ncbi:hypothetical protein GCM10022225_78950 [Plantactinospora mayteni]|uniref:Uncharacterized protein n=1 Tax=Plantactinospora mayteni TaxID=566021 RepID=A0ABQ4F326_9ACTN|nr:hypothetical protein Pma05_78270 [Plantactinospora mayteni]
MADRIGASAVAGGGDASFATRYGPVRQRADNIPPIPSARIPVVATTWSVMAPPSPTGP